MAERMTDAETRVLEVLWDAGEAVPAAEVARRLRGTMGWSRNTTYTLIGRCIDKGAVAREEPGFMCRALASRGAVRRREAASLLERLFEGSRPMLLASMLDEEGLTREEAARLHALIDEATKGGGGG